MAENENDARASSLGDELVAALRQVAIGNADRVDHYRVAKIPSLNCQDPALWFVQVEAAFRRANITVEATKYDTLIQHLEEDVMIHIKDIVMLPEVPVDVYTQVKARIISGFSASAEGRLRQLLKGEVSLDGKPSVLLNRLRALNDGQCNDDVIKTIFLEQLPTHIRAILAGTDGSNLQTLARMADNIHAIVKPGEFQISATAIGSRAREPNASAVAETVPTESLEAKVDWLIQEIKQLKSQSSKTPNYRSRNPSRSKSQNRNKRERSTDKAESKLCYYHKKFGVKAKRCTNPCSWVFRPATEN